MKKLYFNTGEKNIEFYVSDIPKNGVLKFICEKEPLNSIISQKPYYEYREILKGGISGFAVFFINQY